MGQDTSYLGSGGPTSGGSDGAEWSEGYWYANPAFKALQDAIATLATRDYPALRIPTSAFIHEGRYLRETMQLVVPLVEKEGEALYSHLDNYNEHSEADYLTQLQGTPGLERIVRTPATPESIAS